MTQDPNSFLMSSGKVRSAAFEAIGAMTKGVIQDFQVRPQTDFKTKEVLRFSDGEVRKQLVVTVQTEERDDEDDDGRRRLFVKTSMMESLRAAVVEAGAKGIANGGKLAVQYTGNGEAEQGMSPPKFYQVWYQAPQQMVDLSDPARLESPLDDPEASPF